MKKTPLTEPFKIGDLVWLKSTGLPCLIIDIKPSTENVKAMTCQVLLNEKVFEVYPSTLCSSEEEYGRWRDMIFEKSMGRWKDCD